MGMRYNGEWKEDFIDGEGVLWYNNLEMYTGSFKRGKRHGKGTFVNQDEDEGFKYEGDWVDGDMQGHGCLTLFQTGTYEG